MNFGSWLGGQIDIVGFIKALFAKVYAFLFKDEIAKRDADEKATKDEVKGQLQLVKDDAKQVAAVEAQKSPIQSQIAQEQARQAQDERKAQVIKDDQQKADAAIAAKPDDVVLRDDF